ncbi:MAG: hypothetical protein ACOX7C_07075 [Brevefilum sp.]|jgi:type IV secretory pathway ATPase VirB11/archaellum biosynthesis ATPase
MSNHEYKERIFTEDIEDLINRILKEFASPYPEDITDQVFLKIENTPEYLRLYRLFTGTNVSSANPMIGKMVKEITGLKVKGTCRKPKSKLIKSYTILGY